MITNSKAVTATPGSRWAARTLLGIFWVLVGVLGITTLNGWAASGFTHVPNAFMEIFGSLISPVPTAPAGYKAATPALLSNDFESGKSEYLGQKVSIYGKVLPWTDDPGTLTRIQGMENAPKIRGISSRSGTFVLALYVDPEEHPEESSARPVYVVVRVTQKWQDDHSGIQGAWAQVLGTVVPYAPGGGKATPEIQATDVRQIPEPYDIYDRNIPMIQPGHDD